MATETPAPAPAPQHPADRAGHVLVWIGNLLHSVGASILRSRNAELAADLDRARARLRELNREYEKLVTEPARDAVDGQAPGAEAAP